jgi:leader peptidase (prepilin peptidase) / N-methyltransferase
MGPALRRSSCSSWEGTMKGRWRPVLMGITCAAVLGTFAARIGADVVLAPFCIFGLSLVAISFVDVDRYLVPNRILYPTLAAVAPLLLLSSALDHRWAASGRAALGGILGFGAFLLLHLAVPRGMGYGDVRLAGLVGMTVGWLGLGHVFVAFFFGFVLGAIFGAGLMVVTGRGRKTRIPFAPFLSAGAVIAVLWGTPLAGALFHRP